MRINTFILAFTLIVFLISSYGALSLETQSTFVVHMDRKKMKALDESLGPSRRWYEKIIESISISDQDDQKTSPQIHYVYDTIMSGFSAKLSAQHLESLKGLDGFLFASEDDVHTLHTTHSPHFLGLDKGQGLWTPGNLASDVIIGVVDYGIWPEHICFNDKGYPPVPSNWKGKCEVGTEFNASNCNRKLIGAAAFFNGYESKHGRINDTWDYRSPRDSDGHGTHTASTAGGNVVLGANMFGLANGTAAGMRYTARIAAYKACFPGGCFDSDLLAAMEQAVKDGVDVLSISLGNRRGVPYYNDTIAIAAFGAMKKGVIVSMSAGNAGPDSYTVENGAPWLVTVAASSTDRSFPAHVRLGDGKYFTGASLWPGKPTKMLPLVYNETEDAMFCKNGSLSARHVKGKIVICVKGGDIERVEKGEVVKEAGGAGMILANDAMDGEDTYAVAHVLPALMLSLSQANAIINYTKSSGNPKAKLTFQGDVYDNRAPIVAAFSSRGPNVVEPYILKPDVTAPGVNILAAWPPYTSPTWMESDNRSVLFNILSGTSMSCPHVSGIIALLKSLHPDWSPAAIKSALMTTAYVHDNKYSPISDAGGFSGLEPATPFAIGSGHVDPKRAAYPGLIYDISKRDYLDYLCALNYNSKQRATVAGENFICPAGSHFQRGDLNYPSFSVIFNTTFTTTSTYKRTVTNVGIGVSTYCVKVIEPKGVSITVQPKVLKFRNMGEKLNYNVTFKVEKDSKGIMPTKFSFGSLEWVSAAGKYCVRSPVTVTWL